MTMLLRCRDAHQLVVRSMDQNLPAMDRAKLKLHLWICRSCTGFSQQMGWMRAAMQRWHATDDPAGQPGPTPPAQTSSATPSNDTDKLR